MNNYQEGKEGMYQPPRPTEHREGEYSESDLKRCWKYRIGIFGTEGVIGFCSSRLTDLLRVIRRTDRQSISVVGLEVGCAIWREHGPINLAALLWQIPL
jgi:hypothetical protein